MRSMDREFTDQPAVRPANPAFTMRMKSEERNRFRSKLVSSVANRVLDYEAIKNGGADRDRTDDLKLAKLALSQLSYGPNFSPDQSYYGIGQVVGPGRVERPTSRLSGVRSNHLSYEPKSFELEKIEPPIRPLRQEPCGQEYRDSPTVFRARIARRVLDDDGNRKGNEGGDTSPMFKEISGNDMSAVNRDIILRKEVIQPQVPLRLPCYDFTPVADPTVAGCLLAVSAPSSGRTNSHGVTGGVYKARERIHRSLLFCDY
jgi:hypothetical protein